MKTRVFGVLALAMAASVAYAQKVTTDSDPSAPFATYKTYAWTAGTPSPNPLSEQRIHAAVDAKLAGKGLTKVDSAPSVYVATHVLAHEQKEIVADGFGPWWGFGGGTATVQTYVQGTLIVDLYDAATKKMVWRGVATDTASDKPSKNTAKIDKALAKMFERYPPTTSSSSR
jgi:hypothetical protein